MSAFLWENLLPFFLILFMAIRIYKILNMRKFYTYRLSKVQDKATITIASTFSSEFYTKESITTQTTE